MLFLGKTFFKEKGFPEPFPKTFNLLRRQSFAEGSSSFVNLKLL